MSDWQPIETAPLDGSWILAVIADNHPDTGDPFVPAVAFWDGEEWSLDDLGDSGDNYDSWHPTHWMPLPEPPRA